MSKPTYDTTLARMAGNIAAGLQGSWWFRIQNLLLRRFHTDEVAIKALATAEAIIWHLKQEQANGLADEEAFREAQSAQK